MSGSLLPLNDSIDNCATHSSRIFCYEYCYVSMSISEYDDDDGGGRGKHERFVGTFQHVKQNLTILQCHPTQEKINIDILAIKTRT